MPGANTGSPAVPGDLVRGAVGFSADPARDVVVGTRFASPHVALACASPVRSSLNNGVPGTGDNNCSLIRRSFLKENLLLIREQFKMLSNITLIPPLTSLGRSVSEENANHVPVKC